MANLIWSPVLPFTLLRDCLPARGYHLGSQGEERLL